MGFGLLFIGYFFMIFFPIDSVGILPNLAVIGCPFMFLGLKRLTHFCPDCKGFTEAKYVLIPLSVLSTAMLALDIAKTGTELSLDMMLYFAEPLSIVSELTLCIYSMFLFLGIYRLAHDIELPKIAAAAVRRITILCVYGIASTFCGVCSIILSSNTAEASAFTAAVFYIGLIALLLEYLCIFLNLSLLFSSYARICLEGDEDMPYREDVFDKIIAWTKRNKK